MFCREKIKVGKNQFPLLLSSADKERPQFFSSYHNLSMVSLLSELIISDFPEACPEIFHRLNELLFRTSEKDFRQSFFSLLCKMLELSGWFDFLQISAADNKISDNESFRNILLNLSKTYMHHRGEKLKTIDPLLDSLQF